MVTDMVKQRRLRGGVNRQFPPPLLPLWREAIIANKRVIGQSVRFRAFFRLPNLTKFYQFLPKTCSERERRWQLRVLNGGFLRPLYLNPVKSGGSCQALAEIGFRVWGFGVRITNQGRVGGSGLGIRRESTSVRHFLLRTPNSQPRLPPASRSMGFAEGVLEWAAFGRVAAWP